MAKEVILDKQFFVDSFRKIALLVEQNRDYWTQLDSAIGDGDHGINLSIGFRAVSQELPTLATNGEDLNQLFKKIGMILLSKVGGASGPLYGSLLMKMGANLEGRTAVDFAEFVVMIDQGVTAIAFRGKAVVGDKTMIDAFVPGIAVLKKNAHDLAPAERMREFIQRMKDGADSTVGLLAKKGRALRLRERSIGHKDPGAESSWMIMNVFSEEIQKWSSSN